MNKFIDWLAVKIMSLALMAAAAAYIGFLAALMVQSFLIGWEILQ